MDRQTLLRGAIFTCCVAVVVSLSLFPVADSVSINYMKNTYKLLCTISARDKCSEDRARIP